MGRANYLRLPQYEVGGYPKDQPEKVQALFSQAFGGRHESLEMLQWQIERNPCRNNRATTLWDGGTLVAYNALTPGPAYLNGKEVVCAVSGTTMVDEHYPGASLQLLTECDRQNRDIGIIFGYPNRNSFGITVKHLKHHYVGDVAFWTAEPKKMEVSENIREFKSFPAEYEAIAKALSQTHELIKARKAEYLN